MGHVESGRVGGDDFYMYVFGGGYENGSWMPVDDCMSEYVPFEPGSGDENWADKVDPDDEMVDDKMMFSRHGQSSPRKAPKARRPGQSWPEKSMISWPSSPKLAC